MFGSKIFSRGFGLVDYLLISSLPIVLVQMFYLACTGKAAMGGPNWVLLCVLFMLLIRHATGMGFGGQGRNAPVRPSPQQYGKGQRNSHRHRHDSGRESHRDTRSRRRRDSSSSSTSSSEEEKREKKAERKRQRLKKASLGYLRYCQDKDDKERAERYRAEGKAVAAALQEDFHAQMASVSTSGSSSQLAAAPLLPQFPPQPPEKLAGAFLHGCSSANPSPPDPPAGQKGSWKYHVTSMGNYFEWVKEADEVGEDSGRRSARPSKEGEGTSQPEAILKAESALGIQLTALLLSRTSKRP